MLNAVLVAEDTLEKTVDRGLLWTVHSHVEEMINKEGNMKVWIMD